MQHRREILLKVERNHPFFLGMRGHTRTLPTRRWERYISRNEILHLLRVGQHIDLLARLEEVRTRMPYDLELLKSVRILRQHVARQTFPPPIAA